ncbi:hypothetical protein CMEL01_13966 [Colletotrichum melonis]|uniref:Uncharacterized protein n=1 Tax=Colletotrichum melonis TaxID=1209925 RepID=A0AAI9UTL1_9PEZI|nr:hypothetical protein CMEL01_13966 [Colletotrichum melonis]
MLLILILLAGQGSYEKLPDVGARQPCACACACACQTAPWFSSHKRSFSSSQVRHLYHQILLQATIGSNVRPFDWSDRRKKVGGYYGIQCTVGKAASQETGTMKPVHVNVATVGRQGCSAVH